MLPETVVLVTDQPNRSAPLAAAIDAVCTCEVVGPEVDWPSRAATAAIVVDLDLARGTSIRCLEVLRGQPWAVERPVLCVSRRISEKALRQARMLGAHACLPFYTEPHVIVTALLNLINPDSSGLNAGLRQCAERAGTALGELFQAAEARGRVDLQAVDRSVEPILTALEQGGLARWLNTIRAHDDATYQHCLVVAGLAAQFAIHVGFPEAQRRRLVRAALVHDVGKARIPRRILLKRGPLDEAETAIVRMHPILGYEILRASPEADPAMLDAVRRHHEYLDGSGYPDGVGEAEISDVTRFLTICDVYATLTARRDFRPAMTSDEAMRVLHGMEGKIETRFAQAFGAAVARAA
ncbi:HD-GYP domain-containing protein [Methylobacterium sp. A54F]